MSETVTHIPAGASGPKRAAFLSPSGGNIVAAVSGSALRLVAIYMGTSSANTPGATSYYEIRSGGSSGTILLNRFFIDHDTPLVLPWCPAGWCQTDAGDSIYLKENGAGLSDASGVVIYYEIPQGS